MRRRTPIYSKSSRSKSNAPEEAEAAMAEKVTIARPYARAAFQYAREHDAFAQWSEVLASAAAVVADEQVEKLLTNPRVKPGELVELVAGVVGQSLDDNGRNFLNTLAQNRRLGLLPEIAVMYESLRAEIEQIADVEVIAATDLNEAQRARLISALKKRLQREVRLHVSVDAALIGGAIVRSGDLVIDGSLKARLDRLALDIAH
jgi:F-type H+-transporting ATPase subunit delta